jgi:CRISPR-associated protein Csx17
MFGLAKPSPTERTRENKTMFELELKGCRSQPLMSYLKALAVLRLVSEQADGQAVAAWHNETLVLRTKLTKEGLVSFFTDDYIPTPIVGPWAGGSGFFGNDDRSAVNALTGSTVPRLGPYRSVIKQVHRILADKGFEAKPSEENKADLLRSYRRQLPDDFVRWMDCVMVLQADGQSLSSALGHRWKRWSSGFHPEFYAATRGPRYSSR